MFCVYVDAVVAGALIEKVDVAIAGGRESPASSCIILEVVVFLFGRFLAGVASLCSVELFFLTR